jgi:hypothetical protein
MARCRSLEIWAALELCSNRSEGGATVNRSHTVQLHNVEIERQNASKLSLGALSYQA